MSAHKYSRIDSKTSVSACSTYPIVNRNYESTTGSIISAKEDDSGSERATAPKKTTSGGA